MEPGCGTWNEPIKERYTNTRNIKDTNKFIILCCEMKIVIADSRVQCVSRVLCGSHWNYIVFSAWKLLWLCLSPLYTSIFISSHSLATIFRSLSLIVLNPSVFFLFPILHTALMLCHPIWSTTFSLYLSGFIENSLKWSFFSFAWIRPEEQHPQFKLHPLHIFNFPINFDALYIEH